MKINTIELLYLLDTLLQNNCDSATISHGKIDGEPCLFVSGNRFGTKTLDYAPILDFDSPNAPNFFPISADTPAPFIPSFGQLALTVEAYRTAVEHCADLQSSSALSSYEKEAVTLAENTFRNASDSLDDFLSEYVTKVK